MRRPRVKKDADWEEGYYHCINRVVGNQWLLGDLEKEVLRRQMWALAEYCGIQVITYALMSNHTHMLVRVPVRRPVSDEELVQKYRALHPNLKPHQERALATVEADLAWNGPLAQEWRRRQLRQMFDVSSFNKLLKMRFSIWYNQNHERFGTFWSERFKSLVVQDGAGLKAMVAYVDLNCVRAKLGNDPKDYRFCGYAEAVAGHDAAREGLSLVYGTDWEETARRHRCVLFGTLSDLREERAEVNSELLAECLRTEGKLPLSVVLRCRVRYFADGVVLGSEAFVREMANRLVPTRPREPRPLAAVTDWAGLHVLSKMRGNLWG